MKHFNKIFCLSLVTVLAITCFTGCASTRNENGVQIQKQRSWNPLDYVPYL